MLNSRNLLQLLKEGKFKGLEGSEIRADIPIAQSLINRFLQEKVKSNHRLNHLQVRLPGNNRMVVELGAQVPAVFGIKVPVNREIHLRLEPKIDFPADPILLLYIEQGLSGLDRTFINWFEKSISEMVPGQFSLERHVIALHIGTLLKELNFGFLIDFIREASLVGNKEQLLFHALIRIN